MEKVLKIIQKLALKHDKISPELVKAKNIKLGLRNEDGTGVFVGITSKGQVIGYKKEIHADGTEKKIDLDGELYYSGYNVKDLVKYHQKENRFGFEAELNNCGAGVGFAGTFLGHPNISSTVFGFAGAGA